MTIVKSWLRVLQRFVQYIFLITPTCKIYELWSMDLESPKNLKNLSLVMSRNNGILDSWSVVHGPWTFDNFVQ